RYYPGLSAEAPGLLVLFGGSGMCGGGNCGDTWTWDGVDWTVHLAGSMYLRFTSARPGTRLDFFAWGLSPGASVKITFLDSTQGRIRLKRVVADASGGFRVIIEIPLNGTRGRQAIRATGLASGEVAKQTFTVT